MRSFSANARVLSQASTHEPPMGKTTLVEVLLQVVSFSPVYHSHVQCGVGNGPQQEHCVRDLQYHEV